MLNFTYSIPTVIYFGKGELKNLGSALIAELEKNSINEKVLLVYGGGSIKRIGLYDEVLNILKEMGIAHVELGGVEPNPRIESVREGARLCKENEVGIVLAVGGGSSIDCAKAISAAACYDGDAWDLIKDHSKIKDTLPVCSVLTLSATGSEMDPGGVITNFETNEKMAIFDLSLRPVFSILDPTYTFTVPRIQTAAGTADIMSHILESYFCRDTGAYMQDRLAEALLQTCIHFGRTAMDNPEDYEARANLMWASSWAINGLLDTGKARAWTVHPIEHELSAFYDITHGVGLAILTPHWMEFVLDETSLQKFVDYGVNVWRIDNTLPPMDIAHKAIEKTAAFFRETLELPATLTEVGIGEERLEEMAGLACIHGAQRGYKPLTKEDVLSILTACL